MSPPLTCCKHHSGFKNKHQRKCRKQLVGIVLAYEAGRSEFPFLLCDLQYVAITFRAFISVPFILGVARSSSN